jgi:redox-sensitive bicupin YhaK (pirin superfamily)
MVQLGALQIHRALPARARRMIGPWCFVDRYGPIQFRAGTKPMDVGPHPHIGLQAVSWLLDGEIVHKDSLNSDQLIRAGNLSLTTAGVGVAHSEETPPNNSGNLNGVQLWVALPDASRNIAPTFEHIERTPVVELPGMTATVFLGEFSGQRSPGRIFSPLVGADVIVRKPESASTPFLPLDPAFEHGYMLLDGDLTIDGETLRPDVLYFTGTGRSDLAMTTVTGARMLLLGGTPFSETILMWWNFVARTSDELAAARRDWGNQVRFGEVRHYSGPRLNAPEYAGK